MEYSPVLAVGTAGFEVIVAGWALMWRRSAGSRGVLATIGAILLLLAGYQLAEVAICADVGTAGFLPRLAFIIVTWLPPLGLLLIAQLHRPRSATFTAPALGMLLAAAGVVAWIALDRSFASASVCNAVYARYAHAMPRFHIYAGFYWIGLLGMMVLSGVGRAICENPVRRTQLGWVFAGTIGFIAPAMALSWGVPATQGALPSILCHFALVLAVCLVPVIHLERRGAALETAASEVECSQRPHGGLGR